MCEHNTNICYPDIGNVYLNAKAINGKKKKKKVLYVSLALFSNGISEVDIYPSATCTTVHTNTHTHTHTHTERDTDTHTHTHTHP